MNQIALNLLNSSQSSRLILRLVILSLLSSVIYGYGLMYLNTPLVLFKITSILFLTLVVKFYKIFVKDKLISHLLITALIFHAVGDVIIEIASSIVYAIPFFLLGHLIYIAIILRDLKTSYIYSIQRLGLAILLVTVAAFMGNVFLANLVVGILYFSIAVYILVLTTFGVLAVFHPAAVPYIIPGVLLYAASDCLVAYHRLLGDLLGYFPLSWPLYYLAQVFIIFGLLKYYSNTTQDR
ncbi:MAG: hypothetical protein KBD64_05905 [Gammaproteobacteria bacterium]|nr:hypothetical protein [Gammaproteobacteria bacterium]